MWQRRVAGVKARREELDLCWECFKGGKGVGSACVRLESWRDWLGMFRAVEALCLWSLSKWFWEERMLVECAWSMNLGRTVLKGHGMF